MLRKSAMTAALLIAAGSGLAITATGSATAGATAKGNTDFQIRHAVTDSAGNASGGVEEPVRVANTLNGTVQKHSSFGAGTAAEATETEPADGAGTEKAEGPERTSDDTTDVERGDDASEGSEKGGDAAGGRNDGPDSGSDKGQENGN